MIWCKHQSSAVSFHTKTEYMMEDKNVNVKIKIPVFAGKTFLCLSFASGGVDILLYTTGEDFVSGGVDFLLYTTGEDFASGGVDLHHRRGI